MATRRKKKRTTKRTEAQEQREIDRLVKVLDRKLAARKKRMATVEKILAADRALEKKLAVLRGKKTRRKSSKKARRR